MDAQRPGFVEFLDERDGDEVVLRLPNRVHGRLVVAGTLLLVLAAVSVARGLNNGSSGGRSADRSARPSSPPTRAAADPATMANSAYALLGPCPTGAQCFVPAPGAAATALRAAFPGAVLQTAA